MSNVKVGRNDFCPCGSGKKYKKCCENKVISIGHLYEQDMLELQMNLVAYALTKYEIEMEDLMDEFSEEFYIPEEIEEVFYFHLVNWILFNVEIDESNNTVIEKFRMEELAMIKRPRLKEDFARWVDLTPSLVEVKEIVDDRTIIVSDFFTEEQKVIKIIDQSENEYIPQQLVAGIIVPYGEEYTFFTASLDIPLEQTSIFVKSLNELMELYEETDHKEFMKEFYPAILNLIFVENFVDQNIDDIEWTTDKQAEVVRILNNEMGRDGVPKHLIQTATVLWYNYCQKKNPTIKNPAIYAAALHYLIGDLLEIGLSQKELAKLYGVSSSAISSRFNELKAVLDDEIASIEMHLEDDFDEYWDDIFDEDDWDDDDVDWEDDDGDDDGGLPF